MWSRLAAQSMYPSFVEQIQCSYTLVGFLWRFGIARNSQHTEIVPQTV